MADKSKETDKAAVPQQDAETLNDGVSMNQRGYADRMLRPGGHKAEKTKWNGKDFFRCRCGFETFDEKIAKRHK